MSKKVLIIRSTVVRKDSELLRDAGALAESIAKCGIGMLPANFTYEFGEIDGVVWDGPEKKEEKKPEVDWDEIIRSVSAMKRSSGIIDDDPYIDGINDTVHKVVLYLMSLRDKG